MTSKAEALPKEKGKQTYRTDCDFNWFLAGLIKKKKPITWIQRDFIDAKHVDLYIWDFKIILSYIYKNILMHVRIRINSILLRQFKNNFLTYKNVESQ